MWHNVGLMGKGKKTQTHYTLKFSRIVRLSMYCICYKWGTAGFLWGSPSRPPPVDGFVNGFTVIFVVLGGMVGADVSTVLVII